MTDGTDRPQTPQQNGGYGYPPGQIPGGGYGYPQTGQPGPYQPQPAPGPGQFGDRPGPFGAEPGQFGAEPGQFGAEPGQFAAQPQPQPFGAQPEPAAFSPSPQPDWQALADDNDRRRSRRKAMIVAGSAVAVVLAVVGGYLALGGGSQKGPDKPNTAASGSASPSPSKSEDNSPTVGGNPKLLRDRGNAGPPVHLALSQDVDVFTMDNRDEIRLKGGPESYAQGPEQAVDVTKSFTITTRVYTVVDNGSRMAISQGDGNSFSFELGFEAGGGKKSWVFRVQTGDQGAAATTQQVVADAGADPERKWVQLTGTYDAGTKTITLYVNDKPAGQAQVPGIWAGPGPLQLGRARHHGVWSGSWVGSMDRIRFWDKVLTPQQVATLDSGKLDALGKPTHAWLI
ncbi:LamG domain-containing protein [Streptomyces antimicrobicus]|uniref:LamG-like jellyroll fold domain-containing protein n=1 Tax=Streptomyces antimicrobicus TaxID=2883108 RepID=A0ABS8B5X1_9ACTN|nr:LamG domain-containing protein [Streptomyces antimicrobicus]MCB5180010.1 hypothetical protein [Streptomyces antimicrobicus]